MGLGKYGIVGKSQPVLITIDPIIFTRTHSSTQTIYLFIWSFFSDVWRS
eukprot:COSAG01_NODE_43354_length_430_cov_3.027190_1_plen_48_part_10